jgi:hypothetical protein
MRARKSGVTRYPGSNTPERRSAVTAAIYNAAQAVGTPAKPSRCTSVPPSRLQCHVGFERRRANPLSSSFYSYYVATTCDETTDASSLASASSAHRLPRRWVCRSFEGNRYDGVEVPVHQTLALSRVPAVLLAARACGEIGHGNKRSRCACCAPHPGTLPRAAFRRRRTLASDRATPRPLIFAVKRQP